MAQTELGTLYRNGEGVPKDEMKAFDLYLAASRQGNPYAQFELAEMYELGVGVNSNIVDAFAWASVACVYAPYFKSYPRMDRITKKLSASQRSIATQRTREIYEQIESKLGKK
jgi:hypothetical protein